MEKVLLTGNPNVGKSTIFSQLTGINTITSNYPGTTVSYTKGTMTAIKQPIGYKGVCDGNCGLDGLKHDYRRRKRQGRQKSCRTDNQFITYEVIDVPGAYRLDPTAEAEKIAASMVQDGDIIVNVIDATNLERNLFLALQLLEYKKPMIIALNMWDEAKHKGITIDIRELSNCLGVPVIATNGLSGEGTYALVSEVSNAKKPIDKNFSKNTWKEIGKIIARVQNLEHRHHTLSERIQDISIHPIFGPITAILSLYMIFKIVLYFGELLVGLMEKLFILLYSPLMYKISEWLSDSPFFHSLLVGNITLGGIEYESAMGALTTGVFMTIGIVLPYIFVFYIVLGLLEDIGYLPRIAIIFDKLMHRVGIHGYSIIPMFLALGCNVPGVMAIRNLESRRERFITAVIMCTTIPCMAQSAVMLHAVGANGPIYVFVVIAALISVWLLLGSILGYFVKGEKTALIMEIPPYRKPTMKVQLKRLGMRVVSFLKEAVPYVIIGIVIINIAIYTGVLDKIADLTAPIISKILGLPKEAIASFLIGIVRKDAAVVLLESFSLSPWKMVTAITALILYFPCLATFIILLKEIHFKDTMKAVLIMSTVTLITGFIMNILPEGDMTPYLFVVFSILFAVIVSGLLQKAKERKYKT
ncbi:MAG: ferrous iron transporter B [Clostridiales bacterium]|nr:ferrous iron transporter B [Clostridiales bacterium]